MSDNNDSNNKVFGNKQAMIQQLEAMGMPRQMLQNLTEEQKKVMFAMTQSSEIQARAQERAAHEEEWKKVMVKGKIDSQEEYEWKNTRDDVFVKIHGIDNKHKVKCDIQPNHIKIITNNGDDDDNDNNAKIWMDLQLFQSVNVKESSWEVQGDTLAVCLRKAQAPMRWLSLHR